MSFKNGEGLHLVMTGAPGTGKGTQASVLKRRYGICHLSTGEMLREEVKKGTEIGNQLKDHLAAGGFAPDELMIKMVSNRIEEPDCKKGFILDGFPRTIPQAKALDEMGVKIDVVLNIEVSDEDIVKRMSGRRTCPKCGSTYHIEFNPTKTEGVCDNCGTELTVRKDDHPDVVKSRLDVYHSETEPLKAFYEEKGILRTVVGQKELKDTTALTAKALGIED